MARKMYMHHFEGLSGYMPDYRVCVNPNDTVPSDITYGIEEHYFNIHNEEAPNDDLTFLIECWKKRQDAIVYCTHPNCLFYVSIEFYTEDEHHKLHCEINE
jgi:hypothetical protein